MANTSFTVSIASLTSTIMCRAAMLILYRINQHLCILLLEMEEIRKVLLEGKVGCIFQMLCLASTACFPNCFLAFVLRFRDPQPEYSAFREASYGHSTLEIMNRTHALYHWNRNDEGKKVSTDSLLLHNQYW